jgi:hypothetical protein
VNLIPSLFLLRLPVAPAVDNRKRRGMAKVESALAHDGRPTLQTDRDETKGKEKNKTIFRIDPS